MNYSFLLGFKSVGGNSGTVEKAEETHNANRSRRITLSIYGGSSAT